MHAVHEIPFILHLLIVVNLVVYVVLIVNCHRVAMHSHAPSGIVW